MPHPQNIPGSAVTEQDDQLKSANPRSDDENRQDQRSHGDTQNRSKKDGHADQLGTGDSGGHGHHRVEVGVIVDVDHRDQPGVKRDEHLQR